MTLPQGWCTGKLGDVLDVISGFAFKSSEYQNSGHFLIRIGNVQAGEVSLENPKYVALTPATTKFELHPGDILTSLTGNIGRVARISNEHVPAALNQRVAKLQCSEALGFDEFLYKFLQSVEFREALASQGQGAAQQNVSPKAIAEIPFWLPPLAEQRRIVAKLDALTARLARARAELDRVPVLADQLRKQTLSDAFAGRSHSSRVPFSDWLKLAAAEACQKVQSGGTPKGGFTTDGVPFLKVYNIVNQEVAFDYKPQYVTATVHAGELRKSMGRPGDVLMNIVGPPLGKVAIVPRVLGECNFNQALTMFRPSDLVTSDWLYYFLCSGHSVSSVVGETRGIAGQVNISLSQCRAFEIPVPPVDEQNRIVADIKTAFARADRMEAEAARARALLDRLEAALLARAFRGELVPQDPADEPAEALLARIRAQRAAAPKAKRGRRAKVAGIGG